MNVRTNAAVRRVSGAAVLIGACAMTGAAFAQTSAIEQRLRMGTEANEFYLFDDGDVKVMEYRMPRDVRICNDTKRHKVPLQVTYDGKVSKVRPGHCFAFEAKTVSLRPAEPLDANWDLSGTIEQRAMYYTDEGRLDEQRRRTAQAPSRTDVEEDQVETRDEEVSLRETSPQRN